MSLLPSVGKSWWTDGLRWVWSQMVPHWLLLPELSLCSPITLLALRFSDLSRGPGGCRRAGPWPLRPDLGPPWGRQALRHGSAVRLIVSQVRASENRNRAPDPHWQRPAEGQALLCC